MFLGKNKHFIRFITMLTTVGVLLGSTSVSASAATFSHRHTDACYKNVTKTCSDHEWLHGREVVYRYCPNCNDNMRCIYNVYKESCKKNLVGPSLKKWDIYCETCGTVLEERNGELESHQYTVRELKCGLKESSTAATVSVSADKTGWTNGNVTISCNVSVKDSSFSLDGAPYSFNGGPFGGSSSAEVGENGNYSFTVKDSRGTTVSESISVSNIDKKAPEVFLSSSTNDWTEEGLTISASASDDLSGLAAEAYSFGGEFSSSNSLFVKTNGTYSVTVRDNAGNTSSASITISNIGKDPKKLEEEKRKKEEEEKKKKEEEEKKKKEEEERRKKEDEEKKKKEEESKKKEDEEEKKAPSEDDGKKNLPSDEGRKKDTEDKKEPSKPVVPSAPVKPATEITESPDVSENDVSQNDVSGNLIPINDIENTHGDGENRWIEKTVKSAAENPAAKTTLWMKLANMDSTARFLLSGLLMFFVALIIFSTLDFVYSKKDGKITPIALAKIKRDKKKMLVKVPGGVLKRDKKYMIFLSPLNRILKKGRTMVVNVDGQNQQYVSEDGYSFVYNG